ncbi:MAG: GDYXXLXY domain-containing protein [Flavobacteriales bacterium]|nr:GDYXXLXY domain-containing protein [Flavobacteriales bacterium]
MNRKPLLFLGIALAQLAVPAWMIAGRERVLSQGEVFKFKTAPIDPRDPFRGEYVRLDFEAESAVPGKRRIR